MKKIRLHQFLSQTGQFSSKKELIQAIRNNEIAIEGKIIKDIHYQFSQNKQVMYKNKILQRKKEHLYYIINKPIGYLCSKLTAMDKQLGKKSVFSLLTVSEEEKNSLFSVGRLDEDSSGLLIITNDGVLGKKLTEPGKVEKTYVVELKKRITGEEIRKIEEGIIIHMEENGKISKYKTLPCRINKIKENIIEITLKEGKKREIKRMMEAVNNYVVALERISIGKLQVGNLKQGAYRNVRKEEIF
ncbi:rRNA pseudouridine synthase [Candidatus Woesearchaeota archaeon]|nr:MAG: rRNA pseudouridine synthase [Candidatus Woesearchaeota archaeon]